MLGVNSEQKVSMQHYNSDSIYGLTLAWITSENSTKQLECRHLDLIFFAGPYLLCYCLTAPVSGVRCRLPLSVVPRQLFSAPFSNQPSSRVPLPLPATLRFQVQKHFVWFRAKTDKGIVCLAGHLYSVTKEEHLEFKPKSCKSRRTNKDVKRTFQVSSCNLPKLTDKPITKNTHFQRGSLP